MKKTEVTATGRYYANPSVLRPALGEKDDMPAPLKERGFQWLPPAVLGSLRQLVAWPAGIFSAADTTAVADLLVGINATAVILTDTWLDGGEQSCDGVATWLLSAVEATLLGRGIAPCHAVWESVPRKGHLPGRKLVAVVGL